MEFRDGLIEQIDEVSAVPAAPSAQVHNPAFEAFHTGSIPGGRVLYDAESFKTVHVEFFIGGIEFLKVFLAGGVAGKEVYRPFAFRLEFTYARTGFFFAGAFDRFVTETAEVAGRDVAEGDEVELQVQLGEKEVAVVAEQAGHEAKFPRFLGGHEVAPDIVGSGEGLLFLHPPVESVQEAAVGKGDVCKTRGGNGQFQAATHEEHFHDALAGAHHVDGVSGLIGGYAKILAGTMLLGLAHSLVRIEDVDVHHAHQGEGVLLASDMLERRKIQDVIISRP